MHWKHIAAAVAVMSTVVLWLAAAAVQCYSNEMNTGDLGHEACSLAFV